MFFTKANCFLFEKNKKGIHFCTTCDPQATSSFTTDKEQQQPQQDGAWGYFSSCQPLSPALHHPSIIPTQQPPKRERPGAPPERGRVPGPAQGGLIAPVPLQRGPCRAPGRIVGGCCALDKMDKQGSRARLPGGNQQFPVIFPKPNLRIGLSY